jgi:hypothetical protein
MPQIRLRDERKTESIRETCHHGKRFYRFGVNKRRYLVRGSREDGLKGFPQLLYLLELGRNEQK